MREAVGSLQFAPVSGSGISTLQFAVVGEPGIAQNASFEEERRDNKINGSDYIEMVDIK